jgi:hypothetical protein
MSHGNHAQHNVLLNDVIALDPNQDLEKLLRIIQTMRTVLQTPASEELKKLIALHMAKTNDARMRGFLRLLASDDESHRAIAEEGFRILEQRYQELQASKPQAAPKDVVATPDVYSLKHDVPAANDDHVSVKVAPAATARVDHPAAIVPNRDARYIHYAHPSPEVQGIDYPTSSNPNAPRTRMTYITSDLTERDLGARIARVAGLVVGIKGQKEVEHGFGFYLPFDSGTGPVIDYSGKTRNIIRIAMGLPQTIAIFDDHRGAHFGGVSDFFTIFECMKDGYRFLLDLEIIPVNGRFALSIQPHHWIDRLDANGQPARVSSAHLKKLLHAADNIDFIAFTGEVEVS